MIPYFELSNFSLGPIAIQLWGLLVAAGILLGLLHARELARRVGLEPEAVFDMGIWAVVGALVMGRVGYVLLYAPGMIVSDPIGIFRVWEGGMSSFGGYVGAALAIWLFFRVNRTPEPLRYLEVGAFAFPVGYAVGRLGCFVIHDHPGIRTAFPLAVDFPAGPRLDHGLLLSIAGLLMFLAFLALRASGRKVGEPRPFYLCVLMIAYGVIRFGLDFLRAWNLPGSDARYMFLTPSQYGALILVVLGVWLALRFRRAPAAEPVIESPSA